MRKPYGILGFFFVLAGSTTLVYADMAPPPPYNADCTFEKQQKEGEECLSCSYVCEKHTEYRYDGYEYRCRTAAGDKEVAIYCRPIRTTVVDDAGLNDAQASVISSQPGGSDAQASVINSQPGGSNAQVSVINSQPSGDDTQVESEKAGKTDKSNCSVAGVGRARANPSVFLLLALTSLALFVRRRG